MAGQDYRLGESSIRAVRKLNTQGLQLPDRPDNSLPQMPADITAENDEELMVLFGEVHSWLDYTEVQLAAAQIDEKWEEQVLAEILALIQIEHKDEGNVTTVKAMAYQDDEYVAQKDKAHQAYAYRKIIETMYNRLDRAKFIISREITRRNDK